jgi:integrase
VGVRPVAPGGRGVVAGPEGGRRTQGHLLGLDLRGPDDLRHTFATWLEDDGIPARVIDELMGQAATRRSSWAAEGRSAMGAV